MDRKGWMFMSKYKPLERYLRAASGRTLVDIRFSQIERLIGSRLPESARKYAAWWSNEDDGTHVQAKAWRAACYRAKVDVANEKVTFVTDSSAPVARRTDKSPRPSAALFGSMKGTTTLVPGVDLTQPTAPEWGKLHDE
jgi:hypothetical protein